MEQQRTTGGLLEGDGKSWGFWLTVLGDLPAALLTHPPQVEKLRARFFFSALTFFPPTVHTLSPPSSVSPLLSSPLHQSFVSCFCCFPFVAKTPTIGPTSPLPPLPSSRSIKSCYHDNSPLHHYRIPASRAVSLISPFSTNKIHHASKSRKEQTVQGPRGRPRCL